MLRRSSTKSSNRLSRRRSTSSAHSKAEHIDPEVSRQHAQAAATHAFARAQERSYAETGHRNTLHKKGSKTLHQVQHRPSFCEYNTSQGNTTMRRQQSVRFAGPTAVTRHRSVGTRAMQNQPSSTSLRPRALTTDVPVPAAYRPPSRSSSIGKASIGKSTAESYITALAAYDEYYTREDDVASTPSSYRRIRRSKSFASPIKVPSIVFNNGIPGIDENSRSSNRLQAELNHQNQSGLRAPKSMSFLRGGRDHMTPAIRQNHDVAVQIARDKFLHQIEQQRLREQPSFLFRSRTKREEKPFRRSVRSSSTNSYGMPIASPNQSAELPKDESLRVKARKASQSLKNKLKGLFKKGVANPEDVPKQQFDAHMPHAAFSAMLPREELEGDFLDVPRPDSATVSRVASRLPSLHAVPSSQQLRSRTGSVQSLRSEGSGKSRVTSWTSTRDDTLTSRHTQSERERQRLSIIQENGTHHTSSSFTRQGLSNQFSSYQPFHKPKGSHGHPPTVHGPVDSARVYSALMKRLDQNSPKAKLAQRMASSESLRPPAYIPSRSSSITTRHSTHGTRTPATIRQVHEEPAVRSEKHQRVFSSSNTQDHDDVFSPKLLEGKETADTDAHRSQSGLRATDLTVVRKSSYSAYPPPVLGDMIGLTPQQIALRNEPVISPHKGLRESRSTFFGHHSFVPIQRTQSPYRRALAEPGYNPSVITGNLPLGSSPVTTFLKLPPELSRNQMYGETGRSPSAAADAYSESIYSRTTSGQTPAPDSVRSRGAIEDDLPVGDSGSAVLVEQLTYRSTPAIHRVTSSAGSTEWKSWMSAQVSAFEKAKGKDDVNSAVIVDYALPSMPKAFGHVRERAQIDDDEPRITTRNMSKPMHPLGVIQHNVLPKPILKNNISMSAMECQFPIPPAPPIPPRSPLRTMQSRSSLRSVKTTNTDRSASTPGFAIAGSINRPQLRPENSNSTLKALDGPARLIKKGARRSSVSVTIPSPGIGVAVEKQFGSVGSRMGTRHSGVENSSPAGLSGRKLADDGNYGEEGAGLAGPSLDAQALGSKRMVELFLSSRRRRVAGSDESNAFL